MQKVYSSPDIMMVYHVKNLLEEGIECALRGEHLAGAVGGFTPFDAWVEVWVADEARLPEASGSSMK